MNLTASPSETPLSSLFDPACVARILPGRHKLVVVPVSDGIELCHWQSAFDQPMAVHTRDDSDRVVLSYQLRGSTECWLEGGIDGHGERLRETSGSIYFAPDRRSRFCQRGICESVSVMLRPDLLRAWLEERDAPLRRSLDSGSCFRAGYRGEKLHEAAHTVSRDLKHPPKHGARLIREAHALMLVGLFLETGLTNHERSHVTATYRRCLLDARDYLLADLARPPTLAQMAAVTGISAMRIKRGFRELFGYSVYGLFQRERMRDARRRLLARKVTVMEVAFDLGYSNPSHFAAAFRKEFGIAPGEFKRGADPLFMTECERNDEPRANRAQSRNTCPADRKA